MDIRKHISKKSVLSILAVIGAVSVAATLASCGRQSATKGSGHVDGWSDERGAKSSAAGAIRVKSISPRRDASLEMTVEEPAFVEAYHRANLEARVAGPVKYIQKGIGAKVEFNERLIEIDVPDLAQEVAMKQAAVEQRKSELAVAEASVKITAAAMHAAAKDVTVSETEATAAGADEEFRRMEYERFKKLKNVIYDEAADEKLKWYNTAKAHRAAADAAILKSQALLEEATEKHLGAQADVDLKKSLIKVAEADREQAQARLDLATIRAPWDGNIVDRGVDPGAFVHSAATTERGKPLLALQRTDLVTVNMKVPDTFAPYVNAKTDAVIEMDGHSFRTRVTRYAGTLQNLENDRSMRVEVDLFNRPAAEWNRFKAHEEKTELADLKDKTLPQVPVIDGDPKASLERSLMPGMYGKMKLLLRNFGDVYMLPSDAIVREGGTPYVYVIEDGVAQRIEVAVDLDDGKLAHVQLLVKEGDKVATRELTGKEEIVYSNQGELSEGQAVSGSHVDW
jgi:multidrug resistance efflux pump